MEEILRLALVVIVGGVAGWLATRLFKTGKQNNLFMYIVIGVIGAVVGRALIQFVGFEIVGQGVVIDFIVAFVGSSVLVGVSKLIAGKVIK